MTRRIVFAVGVVLSVAAVAPLAGVGLLAGPAAWAGPPTEQLRGFFAAATRILEDPALDGKPEERLTAIRALAREMFDFHEAARFALGTEWVERTAAEREEFVRLFSDLLERAFIAGVASRTQIAEGVKVDFVGESMDGQTAVVRTTMLGRNGHDLPFDYRLAERDGHWIVRDVAIDGVSLTANYRAQFTRVIQASSYPELVRQMQERFTVASLGAEERAAPAPGASADSGSAPASARGLAQPVPAKDGVVARPASAPATMMGGSASAPAKPDSATAGSPAIARPRPRAVLDTAPSHASSRYDVAPRRDLREPVAAPPATTPVVRADARISRSYWVQVAALKSLEAAMRMAMALQGERLLASDRWAVVMNPGAATGSALARVRVGPFSDRTAAWSSARELEARGYQAFVAEERD
jgi:phospholipid transport system substrate-binding protein